MREACTFQILLLDYFLFQGDEFFGGHFGGRGIWAALEEGQLDAFFPQLRRFLVHRQAAAESGGGDILQFAALMHASKLQLLHQIVREIQGGFHGTRKPESQLSVKLAFAEERVKAVWLEIFGDALHDNDAFPRLALDRWEEVEARFDAIHEGEFERVATGWPTLWSFQSTNREQLIQQL
jgi:hypothetical protein